MSNSVKHSQYDIHDDREQSFCGLQMKCRTISILHGDTRWVSVVRLGSGTKACQPHAEATSSAIPP